MIQSGQRGFVMLSLMACVPGCGDDDGGSGASRRADLCDRLCDDASEGCADFDPSGCRTTCEMTSTPGCEDARDDVLACLAGSVENLSCDAGAFGLSAAGCEAELRAISDCIANQGDCDVQGPCLCDDGSQGERDCLTAECNCIPPGP